MRCWRRRCLDKESVTGLGVGQDADIADIGFESDFLENPLEALPNFDEVSLILLEAELGLHFIVD
jgi:hypothetical protein